MGLIMGLLTLPLAPVRGTVWIAERLEEQALEELNDETALARAASSSSRSCARPERWTRRRSRSPRTQLVQRLMDLRGYGGEEEHGGIE